MDFDTKEEPMQSGEGGAFSHLGDLLSAFDDDDYDNILGDEEPRTRGETSPERARKARRAQSLPEKFTLLYKRGADLYLDGEHEEALETFMEISHGVKNYAPLYNQMADCLQCLGRMEEAFEACRQAVAVDAGYLEAWARYVELAELTDSADLVHGLKKYIRLNLEKGDTSVLPHIRRLIELLETDKTQSANRIRRVLFHLQYRAEPGGNRAECFLLGQSIARTYLASQRADQAIKTLQPIVSTALANKEVLPNELISIYMECLLEKKQHEEAFRVLSGFKMIDLVCPSSAEAFRVDTVESVDVKAEVPFAIVTAACIVMTEFDNYESVAGLIQKRILAVNSFPDVTLLLSLATSLFNKKQLAVAEEILGRLYQQPDCHTPEFFYQLGKVYESRGDVKHALDAFNRALSLRSSFRDARYRIRRLGMPVPRAANLGTVDHRNQAIKIQKQVYREYLQKLEQKDDAEALIRAVEMVTATFAHLDEPEAIYESLLLNVASPLRMDFPLQDLLLYAPCIATNDVPLEQFWQVIIQGCGLAFRLKNYKDMIVLCGAGLRTGDFGPDSEKKTTLRKIIVIAAYYLHGPRFSLRYFRDHLTNEKRAELSPTDWNFFYLLVTLGGSGQVFGKWAARWISLYGYSAKNLNIVAMSANDALRRGNYRHAHELYSTILNHEMENAPWYVLLHMGIICVNLACATHCGSRVKLYTTGMIFLEKYGARRGVCPEVLYNKARAAQQFGDTAEAMHLYEECVELCDRTNVDQDQSFVDFRVQALFNLRLLYIRNGNVLHLRQMHKQQLSWKTIKANLPDVYAPL
ncbi:hypothetical protein BV898_16705 [Hypsibius exemplaris]|uniref:General transcription factor 3C polypeptide 3 n=1 Tax=Hypsibius exemplaris TaxID=2072580 RepID=A0A9X6NE01_HYPEX|nr:hypothetical protein BV898_16705 [Hypsibius exemplaris]